MVKADKINISLARPEDAKEAQLVFYQTWLHTYPNEEHGITLDAIKQRYAGRLTDEGIARFADKIANPEPNTQFLVARQDNKIIGACRLRKDDMQNQLGAIYVLPEWQRLGVGDKLWQEAQRFFDADKDIVVNVATYNNKAINFYKKLGFVDTGKRFSEENFRLAGDVSLPEMEMVIRATQQSRSQTEVDQSIIDFLGGMTISTPDDLIDLKNRLLRCLEFRPYNEETKKHADSIQWKRTASEILRDKYVYEGKACSDLTVVFLTLCKAAGVEGRLVKLISLDKMKTHSIAEINLHGLWYRFNISKKDIPIEGALTNESIWNKEYKVWQRGRDVWDLGLASIKSNFPEE